MTIMTCIQPTHSGSPQLGNILGSLFPLRDLSHNNTGKVYTGIATLHATTTGHHDPKTLIQSRKVCAASLIAIGLGDNEDQQILFDQSKIIAIPSITLMLSYIASLGPLTRMTQYKDKSSKTESKEIPFGLLSYPLMMAADILSLQATHVPVGEDQLQHLQLYEELVTRFNHRFKTKFPIAKPYGATNTSRRIMDLKDPHRKMSKSHPNGAIFLDDDDSKIAKAYKRATTDADLLPSEPEGLEGRPGAKNLLSIYSALSNQTLEKTCAEFGGLGFGALKNRLTEQHLHILSPIRNRFQETMNQEDIIHKTLESGNEKTNIIANKTQNIMARASGIE